MQRRFNVIVPMACPHCRTELLLTLEQLHTERRITCSLCGTTIVLRPEEMPATDVLAKAEPSGHLAQP